MLPLAARSRRAVIAAAALAAVGADTKARKKRKPKPKPEPLAFAAVAVQAVSFDPARGTFNWDLDIQARHPASGEAIDLSGTTLFGAVEWTQEEARDGIAAATRFAVSAELQRRGRDVPSERIAVVVL
jgi:hypothetical protein